MCYYYNIFTYGVAALTALAIKATLASAGTLAPAAYIGATYTLTLAHERGARAMNNFQNAWDTWRAHNSSVTCPECGATTTQAALEGRPNSSPEHVLINCSYMLRGSGGTLYLCQVPYRRCRGSCPNSVNHYSSEN